MLLLYATRTNPVQCNTGQLFLEGFVGAFGLFSLTFCASLFYLQKTLRAPLGVSRRFIISFGMTENAKRHLKKKKKKIHRHRLAIREKLII